MTKAITQYHAVRGTGNGVAVMLVTITTDGRTERTVTMRDSFEQATDEMKRLNEILFGGQFEDRDHGPVFVKVVAR